MFHFRNADIQDAQGELGMHDGAEQKFSRNCSNRLGQIASLGWMAC